MSQEPIIDTPEAIAAAFGVPLDAQADGNYYTVHGQRLPRVTSILKVLNKPALVNWAAKVEREHVLTELEAHGNRLDQQIPRGAQVGSFLSGYLREAMGSYACNRRLYKAGDIGTELHSLIRWSQMRALGMAVPDRRKVSDAAELAFMAFDDWAREKAIEPIAVEFLVYDPVVGYAGRLDWFGLVEGRPAIIDWKTGSGIYDEAHLQSVAYRAAFARTWRETCPQAGQPGGWPRAGQDYPDGWVIRLPKELWAPGATIPFEARPILDDVAQTMLDFQAAIRLFHRTEKTARPGKKTA